MDIMHKLTPIAILFTTTAQAATYTATTGPVGLYVGAGTGKMLSTHADLVPAPMSRSWFPSSPR